MLAKKEMESLTRGLSTKADKIRALHRAGAKRAAIADFLGISYQHAHNVLSRSGLLERRGPGIADRDDGPRRTTMDQAGRIEVPAAIRSAWNVAPGEDLLVRLEGDQLRVFTQRAGLRLAQEIVRRYVRAGESLSSELLADRRRETE
jgi:bifunctional DNA-binding transcriptional regulator/antitoxin component of YhaV-PrlF toxin-antitoxin module